MTTYAAALECGERTKGLRWLFQLHLLFLAGKDNILFTDCSHCDNTRSQSCIATCEFLPAIGKTGARFERFNRFKGHNVYEELHSMTIFQETNFYYDSSQINVVPAAPIVSV